MIAIRYAKNLIMRRIYFLVLVSALLTVTPAIFAALDENAHVVLIVWDGMRPDFVTEKNAPTLWKFAQEGVTFQHHHSVFPTSTNVNGAVFATGVFPNRNGIGANNEYRPLINALRAVDTAELETIAKGDATAGGKYLLVPTIAEQVRAAGGQTAVAGAKAVPLLMDRHAEWTKAATTKKGATVFVAAPMPASLREETELLLGPIPTQEAKSHADRSAYAARTLTDVLWRNGVPALSTLWLGDPDLSQHDTLPGSDVALAAIRNCDRALATILDGLTSKGVREKTDVFVVSDHGFSTVERTFDFAARLREAGFDAATAFKDPPKRGQILVVGLGGTVLFYVIEHDRNVTRRLTEWLQQTDFAAVVFTRETAEGAFLLQTVNADTANSPDVMAALHWNDKSNTAGVRGAIVADAGRAVARGSHGSIGVSDVHNTLLAAGPHFRRGAVDEAPSGNIDLAATMLHILGVTPTQKLDGRVLAEAMTGTAAIPEVLTETIKATRTFPAGEWQQRLLLSRVGESTYLDEGDGGFTPR